MLSALDHPFFVTLFGTLQSDTHVHFVLEYCEGGELHSRLARLPGRRLPEPAARSYAAQVLLALQYLHLQGVIYRDLKPENVVLRPDGHIRLIDFDLACCSETGAISVAELGAAPWGSDTTASENGSSSADAQQRGSDEERRAGASVGSSTAAVGAKSSRSNSIVSGTRTSKLSLVAQPTKRSNSFVGTEEYLAPETVAGTGHAAPVDWWALGVFVFELLTGGTPFRGRRRNDTFDNILHKDPVWPKDCDASPQVRDLVSRLLIKVCWERGDERGGDC